MSWDVLLTAALNVSVGLLAKAGFEDSLKDLKERLVKADEKKRQKALEAAIKDACKSCGEEDIRPLLDQPRIREEIIAGLLDPCRGFNIQRVSDLFGERYPRRAIALRNFFNALENALIKDVTWGPILQRYQDIRFQDDVLEKLRESKMDFPPNELVRNLNAHLTGSGIIAQNGAVAAGAGGLAIGGSVQEVVQIFIQKLVLPSVSTDDSASSRRLYLKEIAREANLLPWGTVSIDYADPEKGESMALSDVYTALDTMEMRDVRHEEDLREFLAGSREKERIPAQEAADREKRLLIMGDPGSGKSTFLKYITYILAQAGLADDPSIWLKMLSPWNHGTLIPVYVELRRMTAFAGEQGKDIENGKLMLNYLHHMLSGWKLDGFWPELDPAIRQKEEPLLILLDGLDEVPASHRKLIVDIINAFSERYDGHRYLVTCRPYAYVGQPCKLKGFHEVTLAPFSEKQMDRFVRNWYERLVERGRLNKPDAEQRMLRLQKALRRSDLKGLAERPLLLTVMTQLHSFKGKLPDDRVQLYEDAIDLLFMRWQGRLSPDAGILDLLHIPNLKMSDLEAGLYKVAFMAHKKKTEGETADITEAELREWLAPYLGGDWNKAGAFVEYIRERAGLLIRHKTEAYTFPHRTFQEFLAACYLSGADDYPGDGASLVKSDMDRWREVFILSAGCSARSHRINQAIAAVNALCPRDVSHGSRIDPQEWRRAQLAGEALFEIGLMGVQREEAGQAILERVRDWLVSSLGQDKILTPRERASSGRILARIGDPRDYVLIPEKMMFCDIPAGLFKMGSQDDPMAEDVEKPRHPCTIPYDYRISKYPVTNAQFKAFANEGGYREKRYWTEAEAAGYWKDGKVRGYRYDPGRNKTIEEYFDSPMDFGEPFSLPNHPVVGVNWYEALAFTHWLTEIMHKAEKLPEDRVIRLPSEAEWEKASRGTDGRVFPWGKGPDPNRANYDKTGINGTSAAGCFQGGASPYGVEDMSGNIWEWTRSLWGKDWSKPDFGYPYSSKDGREDLNASADTLRVLRGGAFNNYEDLVRCAVRIRVNPDGRLVLIGFRVVASPYASGL